MGRSTKKTPPSGTDRTVCTTSMLDELAEKVKNLDPDRQDAMFAYLERQALDDYLTAQDDEPQDSGPLDAGEMGTLRELISWWRSRKDGSTVREAPQYRPTLPGRRDNRGIRVNRRLMDDTLKKARELFPGPTSGGKLSPTIEFLCWQFLGFDEKYLQEEDGRESEQPDKESDAWSVLHATPEGAYDD